VWVGQWSSRIPAVFKLVDNDDEGEIELHVYRSLNKAKSAHCLSLIAHFQHSAEARHAFVLPLAVSLDAIPEIYCSMRLIRSIFLQVCEALADLHRHGITHCDVKLANFVARAIESSPSVAAPPEWRVYIIDFGLVALSADEVCSHRGTPGMYQTHTRAHPLNAPPNQTTTE